MELVVHDNASAERLSGDDGGGHASEVHVMLSAGVHRNRRRGAGLIVYRRLGVVEAVIMKLACAELA